MAYRFTLKQTVAQNARRVALEQIDGALGQCANDRDRDEAVHELRKRCKKMRALVRLLRGPLEADGKYDADNAFFRDSARELGDVRDSEAMLATYDKVMDRFAGTIDRRRFAPIRRSLTLHHRALRVEDDLASRLARFRDRMIDAREWVEDWYIEEDGFEAVRDGLTRSYRSGRKAMATAVAAESADAVHDWRKHAKYHWYHLRLIERVWKSELRPRREAAKELSEILGDHHDLAVLRHHIGAQNARAEEMQVLLDRRAAELAPRASVMGERLYAAKPKAFAAEIEGWWKARMDELAADSGGAANTATPD